MESDARRRVRKAILHALHNAAAASLGRPIDDYYLDVLAPLLPVDHAPTTKAVSAEATPESVDPAFWTWLNTAGLNGTPSLKGAFIAGAAATSVLKAQESPAPVVKVKPLAWSVILTHGGEALSAQGHDCRIYMKDAPHFNRDEWIAKKKAAAQAAHEQHVLSFLETAPAQGRDEPAADGKSLYNLIYAHTVIKYDPVAGERCAARALSDALARGWEDAWEAAAKVADEEAKRWENSLHPDCSTVNGALDYGRRQGARSTASAIRALKKTKPVAWEPTHQHVKRGSTYRVLGEASVQVSTGDIEMTLEDGSVAEKGACRVLCEGDHLVVYQSEDGRLWARFTDEFEDGRFRALSGQGGR